MVEIGAVGCWVLLPDMLSWHLHILGCDRCFVVIVACLVVIVACLVVIVACLGVIVAADAMVGISFFEDQSKEHFGSFGQAVMTVPRALNPTPTNSHLKP
eukprot:2907878-Rhodomonas_salina.2